MKKLTFIGALFMLCFLAFTSEAQVNSSQVYVSGYLRADGTYVQGYYKTVPNETNRDNFTTKPNINPYTGNPGYIEPDVKSLYSYPSSLYNIPTTSYPSNIYTLPTTTYPSNIYTLPTTTYPTNNYSTPPRTIYTGPNGGQYYINSNGNKTYVTP